MRIITAGLGFLFLAGCSNVTEIRQTPPVLSISTTHDARSVAECIRDGWQSASIIGGTVGGVLQQSGDRYSIIAPGPENPWHVVDISPSRGGATVNYHFYRTWQSPTKPVTDVVTRCSK